MFGQKNLWEFCSYMHFTVEGTMVKTKQKNVKVFHRNYFTYELEPVP